MPQDATSELDPDDGDAEAFVEVDPTGRYGRYKAVLGKGAFKKVYKAFDEWEGIEVAWNQVKVAELVRSSEDLERLYSEVNLLKTLKHKNIIKFYNSWVDTKNEHINFITEIFTSGTLRQYRKKHKRVDLRAVKKWSRQILEGLLYLHGHDPPIIHRDLKCDNIFVNGNNGEVKIGDLGFAAILRHANAAHSVIGTPEFMAPELYEEEYNELVDIYAFGMCVLELVTLEYPYVECSNAAQIYKKVTSGIKPASLAKVTEPSVRAFIEMCIANVSQRMSAEKLLIDPFLSPNENQDVAGHSLRIDGDLPDHGPTSWDSLHGDLVTGRDCIVHSERKDANTIFIKLRIADSTGQFRNIHFPFDIEADTSIAVASEMVHELDLTDQDVTNVADMIDSEIRAHIPEWSPRESSVDETVCESKDDSPLPITSAYSGSGLVLEQLSSGRKVWSDSPKVIGGHNSLGGWLMEEDEQISSSCVDSYEDEDTFKDDRTDGGGTIIENESVKAGYHMEDINYLHSVNQASSSLHSMTERGDNGKDVGKTRCGNLDVRLSSEADDEKDGNGCPNGGAAVESEEVRILVEKVEHLLLAQQKEMDQLKKKHGIIVSNLLKGVSPQIRGRVFELCKCNESSPLKPPMNESGASLQAVSLTTLGMAHSQTSLTTLGMAHSQTSLKSSSKAKEPTTGGGEGLLVRPIFRDRLNSMKRRTNSDLGIAVILRDDLENT